MNGIFIEKESDPHYSLRMKLLVKPKIEKIPILGSSDFVNSYSDMLKPFFSESLKKNGVFFSKFNSIPDNKDFIRLGRLLGEALPENNLDRNLFPYIQDSVILNLITNNIQINNVALQPFSTSFIALHSESSRQKISLQPKYVILMCCEPGNSSSSDTILVPMDKVAERLTNSDIEILSKTRYKENIEGPFFLRKNNGRIVFSFRDFVGQPISWFYEGNSNLSENRVNAAISNLLKSMYDNSSVLRIAWRKGSLLILDNTFYFHAKCSAKYIDMEITRHLKRIRIL